jgi:hypothetical protein
MMLLLRHNIIWKLHIPVKQEMFVKHLCPYGHTLQGSHEWKLQVFGIFQSPRGILCQKLLYHTQNRTLPKYSYDKSAHQISFQYV